MLDHNEEYVKKMIWNCFILKDFLKDHRSLKELIIIIWVDSQMGSE